jgi:Predicted CoA-binding protein
MNQSNQCVLMLGFSNNPNNISFLAARYLYNKGYKLFAPNLSNVGMSGAEIHDASEMEQTADAVIIFIKPERQKNYYNYILSLKPKRIIFNPGTENQELADLASQQNIQVTSGCTIALLTNGLL